MSKIKIVAIVCFAFIAISDFIAYTNPAKGYELSIYESTPFLVWLLLILSITGGVAIIIHQVYTKEYKSSNFWLIGLLILILSRMSLLYIPFIRGYYTWRGDNISHIGSVKDVLLSGHVASDNFYPITHILLTEIISVSGVPIELIVNHSTALFSIFYVVSTYLLATAALPKKDAQLISVASIGGVLFNGYDAYLMPNGWSILYLPLVFFLFIKSSKSLEYRLLLVIMLILYPFFHPLSSTMLVISLLTIGFVSVLLHIIEYKKISLNNILHNFPITQILIVLGILLPWILSFPQFYLNIRSLYTALTTGHSPDVITQMSATLDKINVHGFEFVKLLIKIMGDDIIFLVLSTIAAIILLKSYKKNHKNLKNSENLIILLGITFTIGIMYASYLFNIIPGLGNINSQRLLAYLVLFTPIFAGFSFHHFLSKERTHITASLCIVIIMTASIISILSLYPSPYIIRPNPEVTQMDMYGFEWFVDYKSRDIGCTYIMSPPYRFADAILGDVGEDKRSDIEHYAPQIPDHFNYIAHERLGESYKKDRYAVITKMDKIIYDTVWRVVGRFHKEDFEKLETAETVDKLYTNRECDVWYIHANEKEM